MKKPLFLIAGSLFLSLITAAYNFSPKCTKGDESNDEITSTIPLVDSTKQDTLRKKMQIVFALDATASMHGLIGTAKEKIWSIASSFSQSDSLLQVEVGLLFYRDRGDEFITKLIPLSNDMDSVYAQLMDIEAKGGGDLPESVNQALDEAVNKMNWSHDTSVFKSVFLVGDCPPYMKYDYDVKYYVTCKVAKQKQIVLNTILMGNNQDAKDIWLQIANCAEGEFMQINMDANKLVVETPYDKQIADLSSKMDETRIYYGTAEEKKQQVVKKQQSAKLQKSISTSTAARRAEYNTTVNGKAGYLGKKEMVSNYKAQKIQLEKLKEEELPDTMQKMTQAQRLAYIRKLSVKRDSLAKNLDSLMVKRKAHIEKEVAEKKKKEAEASFEHKVYENVKKQSAKKKIKLEGKEKY